MRRSLLLASSLPVLVLYFDNHTGHPELDLLHKGFADLMVTDLAALGGPQVVPREKLEELLAQLELQQTGASDPATAQKLGQAAGARYAVGGAFATLDPLLRIQARLVEVRTGKVLGAHQVSGEKAKLFELQQRLVSKLAAGLDLKKGLAAAGQKTQVPNLQALLAYSSSLDLADQGRLGEATQAMAEVVKAAPEFNLARQRSDELLRRVMDALQRRAQDFLSAQALEKLPEKEARQYLAYRILEGRILTRALKAHLSREDGIRVVLRGHEGPARALLEKIAASKRNLVGEAAQFAGQHTKHAGAVAYLDSTLPLPAEDLQRARASGLGLPGLGKPFKLQLAQFLLLGHCEDDDSGWMVVAPTLSDLDPRAADEGFRLLEEAFVEADALVAKQPHLEYPAIHVLDTHAEALLRKGRVEEAVAKWQEVLDSYPASTQFQRFERKIQGRSAYQQEALAYPAALKACDERAIAKVMGGALQRRVLTFGPDGVRQTVKDIEGACQRRWPSIYSIAGLHAARIDDCETFHLMFERFSKAGGSARDKAGYAKNYAPHCSP